MSRISLPICQSDVADRARVAIDDFTGRKEEGGGEVRVRARVVFFISRITRAVIATRVAID